MAQIPSSVFMFGFMSLMRDLLWVLADLMDYKDKLEAMVDLGCVGKCDAHFWTETVAAPVVQAAGPTRSSKTHVLQSSMKTSLVGTGLFKNKN